MSIIAVHPLSLAPNGALTSLVFINQEELAFKVSAGGKILFEKNRNLFYRLIETVQLESLTIRRLSVSLGIFIGPSSLSYVPFDANGIAHKRISAINKDGLFFKYDPRNVSSENSGGNFDPFNPSPDDIGRSITVTEIEEIDMFQNMGIKTLLLTDYFTDIGGKIDKDFRYASRLNTRNSINYYIKYVVDKMEESMFFLSSYLESLQDGTNYKHSEQRFKPEYSKTIMDSLQLMEGEVGNLSSPAVKNSNFGNFAISYMNMLDLLGGEWRANETSVYSNIMNILLPTFKTSPVLISNLKSKVEKDINEVKNTYDVIFSGEITTNIWSTREKNFIQYASNSPPNNQQPIPPSELEPLGYEVFSTRQQGLVKLSKNDYMNRFKHEEQKYGVDGQINIPKHGPDFLTPLSLIMKGDKILTTSGLSAMPGDKVVKFRLKKQEREEEG